MSVLQWVLPPAVGALVGYFTNDLAVRMLFHPLEAHYVFGKKLPLTPGLIPAEQERLADKISRLIVETLLTQDDFQRLAENLLTPERVEQAVDHGIDSLIDELSNTHTLHQLAEEVSLAVTRLLERSFPQLVEQLTEKALTPERIRVLLDQIMDSILEQFEISPSLAQLMSDYVMERWLTPEKLRLLALNLLTPANIAMIDKLSKKRLEGRYALLLMFVNLQDVLGRIKVFLDTEEEKANELLEEALFAMRTENLVYQSILKFNPRELAWEDLHTFKETVADSIHDYLSKNAQLILPLLLEKMDLPTFIHDMVTRMDPADISDSARQKIKATLSGFLLRYLDQKLFVLVEKTLEMADIQGVIARKISDFSPLRMEEIIMEVSRKELNMIVVFGAVLGGLIGCFQAVLLFFL